MELKNRLALSGAPAVPGAAVTTCNLVQRCSAGGGAGAAHLLGRRWPGGEAGPQDPGPDGDPAGLPDHRLPDQGAPGVRGCGGAGLLGE